MKVIYDGRKITHISKEIPQEEYYAVSIDVYKISARTSSVLFRKAQETITVRGDVNSWTEKALDEIWYNVSVDGVVYKWKQNATDGKYWLIKP